MPDISERILPHLKSTRLPGISPDSHWQLPLYQGYSLKNLPDSLCQLLGVPPMGNAPISNELIELCGGPYQKVILLVMDGLGFLSLKNYLAQGLGQFWTGAISKGLLAPLTSVSPSTTATVLTTLWTGRSPIEHGILGYELWLKEYGVVANMILHAPMSFNGDTGGLKRAGFQAETFLPVPTLGPYLTQKGISVHAFMHKAIISSGLSAMHFPEVKAHAFLSPGDLWVGLRQLMENHPGEPMYTYAYWGELDELSHHFGPSDERVALEFDAFSRSLEAGFLNRLSGKAGQKTLLLMVADHGLIDTPADPRYDLRHHPALKQWLHIMPTGENRLAFFYLRPERRAQVVDYIENTWPGEFWITPAEALVASGIFGSEAAYEKSLDRMGDLVVLPTGQAYLWWAEKENHLLGRHGGLTPEEMLVPFVALPL